MNKILLFIALMIVVSCNNSENENQERLYADFVLRYIQDNGNFNAKAKFKTIVKGKSETTFFPPTGVSFMELPMYEKNVPSIGRFYEYNGSKHPKKEMIFQFVDQNDKAIRLKTTYHPMRHLSIKESVIEIDSGFTLVWEGEPLMSGEELSLMVEGKDTTLQRMVYTGSTKKNTLYYRTEQILDFPKGKVKLHFMKLYYQRYVEDSPVGGSFSMEYHFAPLEVKVK